MTGAPSRSLRWIVLGSLNAATLGVVALAAVVAWLKWPDYQAVRRLRHAVEASEPSQFCDAIEAVEQRSVGEWAGADLDALGKHADRRVRMYRLMARTALSSTWRPNADELAAVFDDSDEDDLVRCAAASCMVVLRKDAAKAVPSLRRAIQDIDDPRSTAALVAFFQLGEKVTGPLPPINYIISLAHSPAPEATATARRLAEFLVSQADYEKYIDMIAKKAEAHAALH
jgi:hypothetical protein